MAYDSYTKLLLHGDVFPFVDAIGKTVTNTDVTLDTTNKVFGAGSMAFNGSSAFLSLADSADWDFGTGDFFREMRVRFTEHTASHALLEQYVDSNNFITWFYNVAYGFHFYVCTTANPPGTGGLVNCTAPFTPSDGNFQMIAIGRASGVLKMYVNGVSQTITYYHGNGSEDLPDLAAPLEIGRNQYNSTYFIGNMDEIRDSKGIARWTANFTPPIKQYMPQKASTNIIGY